MTNSEVENLFIRLTIVSENEVILMNVSGVVTHHYEYNYAYNIYFILKLSHVLVFSPLSDTLKLEIFH